MNRLCRKLKQSMDTDWTIVWSKRAKDTYFIVLDYLAVNWSKREVLQFMNRVEMVIHALQRNPRLFIASSHNINLRKALVDKNNSFFYSIDSYRKRLIILTFYDNRQDPSKFKLP